MANSELKTKLWAQITVIGKEKALFPAAEAHIDKAIQDLETVNPTQQPLDSGHFLLCMKRLVAIPLGLSFPKYFSLRYRSQILSCWGICSFCSGVKVS